MSSAKQKTIKQELREGIEKSVSKGITLSVFKETVRPIANRLYCIEDEDMSNDLGIDAEDMWTFRFQSWCLSINRWAENYPINIETLKEWAEEEFNENAL